MLSKAMAAPKKATKTSKKEAKPVSKAKKVVKSEEKKSAAAKKADSAVKKSTQVKVDVVNPSKFAVIELAGTQLKVTEGGKYEVSKIDLEKGKTLEVDGVLMVVDGDNVKLGNPYISGAKVVLEIDAQKKDEKVRVFKYKAKARYRRTMGHRAEITRVAVKAIKA